MFNLAISFLVILSCIFGYLSGSIMFAIIISKKHSKDIFLHGSKNPGATNTSRILGKKWGVVVFLLDLLKTIIPSIIVFCIINYCLNNYDWWTEHNSLYWNNNYLAYIPGFFALLGSIFPIYFKFKGGKGVSCFAGILLLISIWITLISLIIFLLISKLKKNVGLGSISVCCVSLILIWIPGINWLYFLNNNLININFYFEYYVLYVYVFIILLVCAILILIRHKNNINQMLSNIKNKKNI